MNIQGIAIDRVIVHEVLKRRVDGAALEPRISESCMTLSDDARSYLVQRLSNALGKDSMSIDLTIAQAGTDSFFADCCLALQGGDQPFVEASRQFAARLTSAQMSRAIPGGLLLAFGGLSEVDRTEYVGVIKAETHSGFRLIEGQSLDFLSDLFMGPQARLYKVGIFSCAADATDKTDPSNWKAAVFDSQLTSKARDAARYFYSTFMGCALPTNGAFTTKRFYQGTADYIQASQLDPEDQIEAIGALNAYMRENDDRVSVALFADRHLPNALRQTYKSQMEDAGIPDTAFEKDASLLKTYIERRKQVFPGRITLLAPDSAFDEGLVTISSTTNEQGVEETIIRIRTNA